MPEANESESSNTDNNAQPQFYQNPEPLDSNKHGELGIKADADYSFAKGANAVMLTALEFALASRSYPIAFTSHDPPTPVAILGLRRNENLFVKDGAWEDRAYIPAYVRRYPFAFLENEDKSRLILCVDTNANAVSKDAEEKFFDGKKPSEFTKKALEFCTSFQTQHQVTKTLCGTLKKHDLLVNRQAEVTLADGEKTAVTDFLVVDEQKLNDLPDEDFLEFRKNGLLPFLYFHLMSLSNFRDLATRCETTS